MEHVKRKNSPLKLIILFAVLAAMLLALFFISINTGSISLTVGQLLRGLFVAYDSDVAAVLDLRFPRILIALMAGAGLSVAGALFQAVLKNPLADPGILGVSSGAGFFAVIATAVLPQFYFAAPLFSFIGGLAAFFLVYTLAWKGSLSPLRIILIGIAVNSLFTGLSTAVNSMSGGNLSGVASIVEGNITMKTWDDVRLMAVFTGLGLLAAFFCIRWCDIMGLEDRTVRGLGLNVSRIRIIISMTAVFLVAGSTAVIGAVSFLGLLIPHIGRLFVGSEHRYLLPFSALAGAILFLTADTVGRTIVYPYEVSASVILAVVGGIAFIVLLKRSDGIHGQ